MLEMKHIYKYYNPGTVNEMCLFQDLNLTVEDGEFVAIVGSNGSGKTSLLNLICGSIPVDSGSITINGENITGQKEYRRMHYKEMLRPLNLGLEDKLHVKVGALSGGQRQAMSLFMSTMTPIDFLILDEHTAALDPKTADINMRLTDQLVREKKLTSMMVTHNLRYAIEYGTRILMMHQGKIILDKKGDEKKAMKVDDVLDLFNEISIECGN